MQEQKTVLIVDDQAQVRELIQMILEVEGYTTLVAADGSAALQLVERETRPIDLLVTDVNMPGMDGLELANRLCERQPGLRVLFVSGEKNHPGINEGVRSGSIFFLPKPFRRAELIGKVKEVLQSKSDGVRKGSVVAGGGDHSGGISAH